jgi:hypothetical protein
MNADVVIGFFVPEEDDEGIYYFSSEHSRSEAGMELAGSLAERLGVPATGRTLPMLKATRAPAVVVGLRSMNRRTGRVVANVIASLYERPKPEPGER